MKIQLNLEDYQPPRGGLILLQCMLLALFCLFAFRFWFLQIHHGEEFTQRSIDNIQRYELSYATRGLIRDVNGNILADNRPTFALALNRDNCRDLSAALAQVSAWSGIPIAQLAQKYRQDSLRGKPFDTIILCPDLTFEQVAHIQGKLIHWPELDIITRSQRYYPYRGVFSHILGYVAEANERELQTDSALALGDAVGKLGLENVFEKRLRGEKGRSSLEVDVLGRVLAKRLLESPKGGESLRLTIDADLQQTIYSILGEQTGSVVVLNPHSGEVRALVTTPAYDNNPFVSGIPQKDWDALRNNPYHPMQNRAIQSAYPPGSVWKLMMAGLFLKEGIRPETEVYCSGEVKVGNQTFRCWRRGGHGAVNMSRSLIESCDVYYYVLGEKLGIGKIAEFAKQCGFGQLTGIDLPHERAGLVPSREWKQRRFNEPWFRGETVNVSIGQGATLTTPLQMAVFVGSLLNGGKLMKPHIVAGQPPEIRARTPMDEKACKLILDAMHKATLKGGTARAIARTDAEMGGKTGTAQVIKIRMVGDRRQRKEEMEHFERDHAWIVTWGRKGGEDTVVVVMLEHGGSGGAEAGPVAKKVFDAVYGLDPVEQKAIDEARAKEEARKAKEEALRLKREQARKAKEEALRLKQEQARKAKEEAQRRKREQAKKKGKQ